VDLILYLKAALMGVVEGLTEFLPVSSTGHLILAGALMDFDAAVGAEKAKVFEIAIQTGAILAVILVYWQRLQDTLFGLASEPRAQRFTMNVAIGFFPAVILGLALGSIIKAHLFTPIVVASTFILGGIAILFVERWQATAAPPRIADVDEMRWSDSLKVGLLQCLALVPGMSRSGASIIGGMLMGLSRKAATEFSFFLGIPTLVGAGAYSLYKERELLSTADLPVFAIGLLFSFLAAWVCVRWLLNYVATHDFRPFAWYRIGFGVLILLTSHFGWIAWTA